MRSYKIEKIEGAYDIPILKDKLNRVIDHLNSQDQEGESVGPTGDTGPTGWTFTCTKCGKEFPRKQEHECIKDTPEEWEKGLEDIVKQWNNGEYVGTLPHTELYDFIDQELDKAREEGKKEAFTKDEWFMLKLAMNDIFNNGNTAYEKISEKIKGYLN